MKKAPLLFLLFTLCYSLSPAQYVVRKMSEYPAKTGTPDGIDYALFNDSGVTKKITINQLCSVCASGYVVTSDTNGVIATYYHVDSMIGTVSSASFPDTTIIATHRYVDSVNSTSGGWSLTGNAGTNSGINSIGTTDNASLNIIVNGSKVATFDSVGNVSLGNNNTMNSSNSMAIGQNITVSASYATALGINGTANGPGSIVLGTSTSNGQYAVSIGYQNLAGGDYSFASGSNSTATGTYSTSFGPANVASGTASTVFGFADTAKGDYSTSFGLSSVASGIYSAAFGRFSNANSYGQVTVGVFNDTTGGHSSTSWITTDPIFTVGNGNPSVSRSTAFQILKNGNVGIGIIDPHSLLQVSGGDIYIDNSTKGLILKDTSNNCWRMTVSTGGIAVFTSISCP